MNEKIKKKLLEQLLINEVSRFELSFYEKMSGREFLDDDLFKILRIFSEVKSITLVPFFLNQEYLFLIDNHDVVTIHRIDNSEWNFKNEQCIFLYKVNEEALKENEKRLLKEFSQKINELAIEELYSLEDTPILPINIVYAKSVKIGSGQGR